MSGKRTWKESHGDAAYIPCGNAYCAEGNCANCEIQMQLQVESKTKAGEELTAAERLYLQNEDKGV